MAMIGKVRRSLKADAHRPKHGRARRLAQAWPVRRPIKLVAVFSSGDSVDPVARGAPRAL